MIAIAARLTIGLCFVFVLTTSFHRAWRWEEDKSYASKGYNKTGETYIYMSPFVLMSVLMIYLAFYVFTQGLERTFYLFADVIANIIPYYMILCISIDQLRKYISARACAILWIFPLFMFYQPHILIGNAFAPMITLYIPKCLLQAMFYVWLLGAITVLLWKCAGHMHFRKYMLDHAEPITDMDVLTVWLHVYEESNYKQSVSLFYSQNAKTPLSMGIFSHTRVVVIPYKAYTEEELYFIFMHEITHLKRLDIDTKAALTLYQAAAWFNPLTWYAIRKANEDIELSCDEFVLKDCDDRQRKSYANLLLKTAGDSRGFTTCLSVDAKAMRYRLKNVITKRNVFRGTVMIGAIFFFFYMSYGTFAFTTEKTTVGEVMELYNRDFENSSVIFHQNQPELGVEEFHPKGDPLDELNAYISDLEVEKYVGVNQFEEGNNVVNYEMYYDGQYYAFAYVSDRLLTIDYIGKSKVHYIVKDEVDWNYVKQLCLLKENE